MPNVRALKIIEVNQGSHAHEIGLMVGDIISYIGDVKIHSNKQLSDALSKMTSDNTIYFVRDDEPMNSTISKNQLGIQTSLIEIDENIFNLHITAKEEMAESIKKYVTLTTAPSIDGYKIIETMEIVSAECSFGINFFQDIFIGAKDIFGGRSKTMQDTLRRARKEVLEELKFEAALVGANAVIASSLHYSEFSGKGTSMIFLVASGTAVKIEPR